MRYITALLLLLSFLFYGCEEVVDVDLDTQTPKLVVDASIDWIKGTSGAEQTIRLTTTAAYYDQNVPNVSGAIVFITDSNSQVFDFVENPGTGNYVCTNFVAQIGMSYVLTIVHEGQTYTASETMIATSEIENIQQDNEGGFLGDEIEVKFFYQDSPVPGEHYLVRFDAPAIPYPDFEVISDEFINGNMAFESFSEDRNAAGDNVRIRLYGISERYYDYMSKLLLMTGGSGGPFGTAPATVRGNLVNQTDEGNFALGFFRLSEVDQTDYVIQ
ncbi:DUF4249 domain-containing protein [Flavobacterium sp.]|uniref:DUF4249 domain-containing protein n=1 Tax=Flavobacterium sp. TaxID=239 RepID=UPI00121419EC|nr:DUF4249 domain-containing protein [Flavobacterium sp.]RZJ69668.1 MAG: DUF4249 domain-containing protein [Flavobacterium sp.]